MKIYFIFLILLFLSCQKNTNRNKNNISTSKNENGLKKTSKVVNIAREKEFLDSIYNCENNEYISVLEEIPNRNSNAYKLTIISKKVKSKFTKILDTRPKMSQIDECNDLYTEVGFPCGGPCYSRVFVFTDKNRPIEQYDYVQEVKNNPKIIAHIKNEKFEKLIMHNFSNNKELTIDISNANFFNYGQMDSLIIKKNILFLYYISNQKKNIVKRINLKTIL